MILARAFIKLKFVSVLIVILGILFSIDAYAASGEGAPTSRPTPTTAPKGKVEIKPQGDAYCTDKGHGLSDRYPQIRTAFGCVPIEINGFVAWLVPILFGTIAAISFLLIIYGFISIATSSGDPKKIQGAKETISSAIIGLLFAIFSLFILRLIVLDILHIPGINRPLNEV